MLEVINEMNRKKKIAVLLILLGLLLALLWLVFRRSNEQQVKALPAPPPAQNQTSSNPGVPHPPQAGTTQNEQVPAPAQQQRFTASFLTPITFYGKVVDQHGEPVAQADVKLSANDKPLGGNPSEYTRTTDAEGLFSISGIVGLTLAVEVSKTGYRVMPPADDKVTSSGLFEYGLSSIKGPPPTDKNAPVIFTLYKYGQLEPLTKVGEKNFRVARDGSPLTIALDPAHQVVLRCWNGEFSRPANQRQYDWKLEISAPDGGVIARKDDFLFEAPETDYHPSDTINMPASLPPGQWHDSAKRSYFVRFNDDTFARVNLEMQAGGDHFVEWESFLNPKTGSRNLGFDPQRQVKSP